MTGPAGPLLMIDCASLTYRAYHAVPAMRAADGTETHAVYGFLGFLTRLLPDRKPSRLWIAMDADWRPAFRVDALPSYKTHRVAATVEEEDPVAPGMVLLERFLDAFGLSTASAEGFEAEDVIATLAKRTHDPVEVVTGDRDLFALVADPGDRYIDYALLRGDPSDGLPGVPGIGEKTASALLAKYGSLEAILSATDLSPTIRAKLRASADYLVAARRVVAPVTDCPVTGGDGTIPRTPAHPEELLELAKTYALEGAVTRVVNALATS
jgi:5'-3' exonuclease